MKKSVSICSLVLLITLMGFSGFGQTIEKSRRLTETYPLWPDIEVEVINKYGNLHVIPWEKDSVRFDIELMVKGSKQSKVDKSFDYIEFDIKASKYYIIAQTLFAGKSSFWSDVSDLTGAIFNSSTKTKIDYTIYLPKGVKLKLSNKYGNIYTTNHSGELEIELSNGDLKANHLSGKSTITIEFGNANINRIDEGMLKMSYGEMEIEQAGTVSLESKSSRFTIEEIDDLEMNSKRDKFFLKNIGYIRGMMNFTTIDADVVDFKVSLATNYGDIDLKSFSDNTERISIRSENTDITFHFTDSKQYEMDFVVDEKTQVMYSADIANIVSRQLEEGDKLIEVKCVVGNNPANIVPVELDSRGGTISLKLK